MKPIAIVIPWYGDNIRGGAEQEANYLAHSLQNAGANIEVFTTCVKDAASDRGVNTIDAGESMESGILVRRFPVRTRDVAKFNNANLKLYHGKKVTLQEEKDYFAEDINSPEMYTYIAQNRHEYKAFLFIPYMYGPTYNGSAECPENCILIPCLHDESYAYMRLVKQMAERAQGIVFLARPEYELANRLFNLDDVKTAILGGGVDTDWKDECDASRFRQKYQIDGEFILFAGRKDAGKKADELLSFFIEYLKEYENEEINLVFIGGGTLEIPDAFKDRIFDLGFVSVEDKHDAFAAATMLCNPSYFESFSLVIMESWIAKRPVVVSAHCAVTTNFCIETNGGLYYKNYDEFCGCIEYILNHQEEAAQMGLNGHEYVMNNFTHEIIAKKYLEFIEECLY